MSLDKGMASLGFLVGTSIVMATNSITKMPTFKRPWLHVATGMAAAYLFGSLPRMEKWVMEQRAKQSITWERRKVKNDAIYAQFQERLAEADTLMSQDPTLLAHKDSHDGHELKFYKKY